RVGFDLLGQAMSGGMHISGLDGEPRRTQIPYVDYGTALYAAFGTMAALMERDRTGQGQMVEASLFSTSLSFTNGLLVEQALLDNNRQGVGNRGYAHAPNDVFQTENGWIVTMVVGRPIFERWAGLMEEPHWLEDERFETDISRGDHAHLISERMARWCAERTTEAALAQLEAARIPAGPVYQPRQVLADPHVIARNLMQSFPYPGVETSVPLVDTPVRFSGIKAGIRHRAPTLGEHTREVLAELGYDEAEIAELREARIV
ncbi:MAG: CoA transferase, partial [Deltaproteobacteria bacterium]|nr:CoA transferase [Deltaproteobacteria bacterium]